MSQGRLYAAPLKPRAVSWLTYECVRSPAYLLGKIFFGYRTFGGRNLPSKGGFIVAGNHVSYLDPLVIGMGCPRHLSYMARDSLFRNMIFGTIIASVGSFPLKRNSADLGALKEGLRRVKAGGGLMVFPEGTRAAAPDEDRAPLAGVGFLALKSGAPVIPAYVSGTEKVLPKGAKGFRFHPLRVYYGEAVQLQQNMSPQQAADAIMSRIRGLREIAASVR